MKPDDTNAATASSAPHRALLVIGMHRAGTSATTGALQRIGVPLGPKLYRGHQNINAKGYFEHADIADTNDEVLLAMGSSWDDIALRAEHWEHAPVLSPYKTKLKHFIQRDFAADPLWALKDPRISRLLPMWLDLLDDAGAVPVFLFALRAPTNVAGSLARRDGFSRDKSMLLWLLHYLEAERASRGRPRTFVDYDQFLEDPVGQLERIESTLDIRFPQRPGDRVDQLGEFISKDLRTHRAAERDSEETKIEAMAQDLYDCLKQAAKDGTEPDIAAIEHIDDRVRCMYASFPAVVIEHMHASAQRYGEVQLVMNKLVRSWSWVTGKPVRFVERLIGRDV